MKIIHKAKAHGKTTDLIERANKLKGYNLIVCTNQIEVRRVWELIKEKKYNIPQPVTFDKFISGSLKGKNINAVLIDNADLMIQYLAKGLHVDTITFNKDFGEYYSIGFNPESPKGDMSATFKEEYHAKFIENSSKKFPELSLVDKDKEKLKKMFPNEEIHTLEMTAEEAEIEFNNQLKEDIADENASKF